MIEKILLFFLFFIPFQFALRPTEGIDLAFIRVLTVTILFLWLAKSFFDKKIYLPRPKVLFFFLAYLLWASVSFFWAENTNWAFRKALFLISFFPLFIVFFVTLQNASFRKKTMKALVVGAVAISIIALLQFFSQFLFGVEKVFSFWIKEVLPFFLGPNLGATVVEYPSLLVNISGSTVMRAIGSFPDPHMFSFFLGMSLPLSFALSLRSERKEQILWGIGTGIIFLTDLLTFSRGGYIGLIFGIGAFFLPLLFKKTTPLKKQTSRIVLALFVMSTFIFFSPIGTRLLSSFSQTDNSNIERLRLWGEAKTFIIEHPIFGSGLGNYPLSVKPTAIYREPIYVHNLYLDIAVELGIVGVFFFLGFLFLGIQTSWKKWREQNDIFSLAIFSSLIIFSVHSLFETPLFSVHILPLLLFLLAMAVL